MDYESLSYERLQGYLPKEPFVTAIHKVWLSLFQTKPSRESMAVIWAEMALRSLRTSGRRYAQEDDLFEQVLDEVVFLSAGTDSLWEAVLAGDAEAYARELEQHNKRFPDLAQETLPGNDYPTVIDLMVAWLMDSSDIPTIPAPAPTASTTTRPETPRSIRAISLLDEEDD